MPAPITGFDYGQIPGAQARQLRDAQAVRDYLTQKAQYLKQGGGFGELWREEIAPYVRGERDFFDFPQNESVEPMTMVQKENILGRAMDLVNPLSKFGGLLGHTVYHGSPHRFDKFDISKIGTGEGAQVYGHGLYFAESPKVAQIYAETLGEKNPISGYYVKGQKADLESLPFAESEAIDALASAHGDVQAAIDKLKRRSSLKGVYEVEYPLNETISKVKELGQGGAQYQEMLNPGSFYKADIPDEWIPKMLDWDAPDWMQSKELKELGKQLELHEWTGADLLIELKKKYREAGSLDPAKMAAQELHSLGIPGIKYYDQMSRGKGEGTRNYVTFTDEGIKILERE